VRHTAQDIILSAAAPPAATAALLRKELRVSHYITQPCIGVKDGSCAEVCPVDCIHPRKDEPQFEAVEQLYINPDACIDCGLCVDECPVKAIFPEDELPEKWRAFIARNAEFFRHS
jgi:NAD-dependent dihydropyrimidine dehydrogenase PreA subunit